MKKLFVILAAIAMVGAFTATTMAADWAFYGNARMATFYESYNDDASGTGDSESTLSWAQQGNSRIGANVDAGAIQGRFEYGFYDDNRVRNRLLYARWSFSDAGYLLLGRAYTPVAYWIGSQVYAGDAGLIGWGAPYGSRSEQVKLAIAGFQVAAIKNSANGGYDTILPKLEARYDLALGDHSIGIFGGYQTFKDTALDEDMNSAMYGLGYTGAFGPVWLNAAVSGGQNMANAGWGGTYANPAVAGGDDTTTIALAIAGGMAFSETMGLQVGVGYTQDENDDLGDDTDTNMAYYVQLPWTIAPGFTVYPEIGVIDMMKDMNDDDEGSMFYAGAKWQMNF